MSMIADEHIEQEKVIEVEAPKLIKKQTTIQKQQKQMKHRV